MVIFWTGAECRLQRRHQSMSDFVIGNNLFLLHRSELAFFLLISGDNNLDTFFQIRLRLPHSGPLRTARSAASLIMLASSAPEVPAAILAIVWKSTSSDALIFLACTFKIASRPARSGSSTGTRLSNLPGRGQRRVKGFRTVGCRQNNDAVVPLKTIHLCQKLV